MKLAALVVSLVAACTTSSSSGDEVIDDGKGDSPTVANVAAKLVPMRDFLRDDQNIVKQLGPPDTTAQGVKKTVTVVKYTSFGHAVDVAARAISKQYAVGSRDANGLVDLLSVDDMYLQVHAGYGDDSFIDKLVTSSKRTQARALNTTLLPEAAWLSADHADSSTGNYVVVLGDLDSKQAIVMTISYFVE
jgi:hypothetical protein